MKNLFILLLVVFMVAVCNAAGDYPLSNNGGGSTTNEADLHYPELSSKFGNIRPKELMYPALAVEKIVGSVETYPTSVNDLTIDFTNSNSQYFPANGSETTSKISIPDNNTNSDSTLVIYVTEKPSENAFYDFDDLNILAYPTDKPWLDQNAEDGIWKFEFANFPGVTYWTFVRCSKNPMNFPTKYAIEDGVLEGMYPAPSGDFVIPDNVTTIGADVFEGNIEITSVEIPDDVTTIEDGAFANCSNIRSIKVGRGISSIGENTFEGCDNVTNMTFEGEYTSEIPGIDNYSWGLDENTVEFIGALGPEPPPPAETIFILDNGIEETYNIVGTLDQQWMNDNGFYDKNNWKWIKTITQVEIGTNVTSIGERAFYDCISLTSMMIPDNVTSIGEEAFNNCRGIMSVAVGNGVTDIGYQAFMGCSGLTNVTIGNGLTSIGYRAFGNCSSLTSMTIPNSVTSIGNWAFYSCTNLTNVTIPDSVTSIENYAFSGCTSLATGVVDMSSKTQANVKAMSNYPWYLPSGCTIICSDGNITIP